MKAWHLGPSVRMARVRTVITMSLVVGLGGAPLGAQYIAPGTVRSANTILPKDYFETRIDESRWQLGRLRLSPWLGVRDAQYVSDTLDEFSVPDTDFTVTIGAGLRGYLRSGPKLLWTAHALPEYVWWQDQGAKRGLNGRLGIGLFGYFNRLTTELSFRRVERQGFFSNEIQELTSSGTDSSKLGLEVEAVRNLWVFGTTTLLEIENEERSNDVFFLLDREEESYTFGLRFATPRGWTFSLGYEDKSTDFLGGARRLSNSGTSELLAIGYQGQRFGTSLTLAFRDFVGDEGSDFGASDETTGALEIIWNPGRGPNILAYFRRSQFYSVAEGVSFRVGQRQGTRLGFSLGRHSLGLYGEIGDDDFMATDPAGTNRIDDVTAVGLDLQFELPRLLRMSVVATYSEYDSNLDVNDRDVTTLGFNIDLGEIIEKLKLGQPEGVW